MKNSNLSEERGEEGLLVDNHGLILLPDSHPVEAIVLP
jgi:hypothetical protein